MSIFMLGEDCWHLICEYLSAVDAVSLANTCAYLRWIVKTNLRLSKSIDVNQKLWHQICRYEGNVEIFLKNCSKNVKQLDVNGMNNMQFEVARKLHMPKIKNLSLKHINTRSLEYRPDNALLDIIQNTSSTLEQLTLTDCFWQKLNMLRNYEFPKVTSVRVLCKFDFVEDYELVKRIFPGITKLAIMAPITSKTLWNLKSLRELEIILDENSFSIISFIMDPTLDRLRLRKLSIIKIQATCNDRYSYFYLINLLLLIEELDELQIDCHAVHCLSLFLIQRKKVRKITFTYDNLFFCNCGHDWLWGYKAGINKFHNYMEGITVNSFLLRKCPNLRAFLADLMPKLKRITIFDKYSTGEDQFQTEYSDLRPQLREYVPKFLIETLGWHNTIEDLKLALLELIYNSELLESFGACENVCDLAFLKNVCEVVRSKQIKQRKPFTLHCYNTKISTGDLKELSKPAGLEIILEGRNFEPNTVDAFQIELTEHLIQEGNDDFMGFFILPI